MNSNLVQFLIAKVKEPSSYVGFFFILHSFLPHLAFTPDQQKSIEMVGESLAGLLLIGLNEGKKP